MPIGSKDKEGNILILGGWKADLYYTPDGLFKLDEHYGVTEEEGVYLYNQSNGTTLKSLPYIPPLIPPPKSIKLPFTKGKVLGIFESGSNPGTYHHVLEHLDKSITCTCFGFRSPDNCWHYRAIMEVGPENLTETIIIKLGDLKKEGQNGSTPNGERNS